MLQTIFWVSIFVVGTMEVVKVFLPENFNSKIVAAITLGLSLAACIGYGIYLQYDVITIIKLVGAVVGLTQTSYNFVLKLLKSAISWLKVRVTLIANSALKEAVNNVTTTETTTEETEKAE